MEQDHIQQNTIVYMVKSVGNIDDTIDFDDECPRIYLKERDAVKEAKEIIEEYHMETYVYKCVPVVKVTNGKIKVIRLGA